MKVLWSITICISLLLGFNTYAKEEHDHVHDETSHAKQEKHEGEHEGHEHDESVHEEHGEGEHEGHEHEHEHGDEHDHRAPRLMQAAEAVYENAHQERERRQLWR